MDARLPAAVPAGGVLPSSSTVIAGQTRLWGKRLRRLAVAVSLCVILLSTLFFGVFRADASDYQVPNESYLFGASISGIDIVAMSQRLEELKQQQFSVTLRNGTTQQMTMQDMGVVFSVQDTITALLDNDNTIWLQEGSKKNLQPRLWTDSGKLQQLAEKSIEGAVPPQDANVLRENDRIVVVPAKEGRGLLASDIIQAVTSLREDKTNTLRFTGSILYPAITTETAERVRRNAQQFAEQTITVRLTNATQTIPNIGVLSLSSHPENGTIEYGFDEDVLREAIDTIATQASTPAWNELYVEQNGQRSVIRPGREGVTYQGVDQAVRQIINSGAANVGREVTLVRSTQAYGVLERSAADTWIDVDLTNHQMTLWEDGKVHNVFPISGGKDATPTPLGEYRITSKTRKMTMSGPGYATPNVEYISWFKYNYAIHSAYWHDRFGEANVSLGCVNARTDDAKYVYEWAPIGTKVVTRF